MKPIHQRFVGFLMIISAISQLQAALGDSSTNDWQLRRLMEPTQEEILTEQEGQIMIYSGLTDKQVETALDRHFDRIQGMMFTSTVITDEDGSPREDPRSGEILTEDDGC